MACRNPCKAQREFLTTCPGTQTALHLSSLRLTLRLAGPCATGPHTYTRPREAEVAAEICVLEISGALGFAKLKGNPVQQMSVKSVPPGLGRWGSPGQLHIRGT